MQSDVTSKSTAAAARALLAGTVGMWEWDEHLATAEAITAARGEAENIDPSEIDSREMYALYAGERAQTEAQQRRGPKVWDVCSTPDGPDRLWALVPHGLDGRATELEAIKARAAGDLVVEPGDDVRRIGAKLKTIRAARKAAMSAEGVVL